MYQFINVLILLYELLVGSGVRSIVIIAITETGSIPVLPICLSLNPYDKYSLSIINLCGWYWSMVAQRCRQFDSANTNSA